MSGFRFLKRLPSEELARRQVMCADASALARRDRQRAPGEGTRPTGGDWVRGNAIQPSGRRQVVGKVGSALLVLAAFLLWFGVGILAGAMV